MKALTALVCVVLLAGCGASTTQTTSNATLRRTSTTTATSTTTVTTTTPTGAPKLGPPTGPPITNAQNSACGSELWAKKTLQDAGASQVNPNPVSLPGVAAFNAIAHVGSGASKRVGAELHTYTFTGTLVEAKIEADSDFHVVMRDGAGKTMVTEYPSAPCVAHAAKVASAAMVQARADIEQACGPFDTTGFKHLSGTATVTGVGFYDRDHGQTGRDFLGGGADGELHPIIAFKGTCR